MNASVLVTTYNAPAQLDLVLVGLSRQTRAPAEILVADDGSTPPTAELVCARAAEFAGRGVPLVHVRHEDDGYRRAKILNEAARRAGGDYFLFLDGDSIPHPRWLEDHLALARPRRVLCGRRVRLGPAISARITREDVALGRLEPFLGPVLRSAFGGGTKRALLGLRLHPWLARAFHPRSRRLMGVNFSLSRADFAAVNGLDEEYVGYGLEDLDLEVRLRRAGMSLYPLLNRAVVWHLYHPMKSIGPEIRARFRELEASGRTRARTGLADESARPAGSDSP